MPLQDLVPGEDFPGPRRGRRHPESDWNRRNWPISRIGPMETRRKGNLQKRFLLRSTDMADLQYEAELYAHTHLGIFPAKRYLVQACERRAWEIYGGPRGLEAERQMRAERRERRRPAAVALDLPPVQPRRIIVVGRGRNRAQAAAHRRIGGNLPRPAPQARAREVAPILVPAVPAPAPAPVAAPVVQPETPVQRIDDDDSDFEIVPAMLPTPPASQRKKRDNQAKSVLQVNNRKDTEEAVTPKKIRDLTARAQARFVDLDLTGAVPPSTPHRKVATATFASIPSSSGSSSQRVLFKSKSSPASGWYAPTPPQTPSSSRSMTPGSSSSKPSCITMDFINLADDSDEDEVKAKPFSQGKNKKRLCFPDTPVSPTPHRSKTKGKKNQICELGVIEISDSD